MKCTGRQHYLPARTPSVAATTKRHYTAREKRSRSANCTIAPAVVQKTTPRQSGTVNGRKSDENLTDYHIFVSAFVDQCDV